MYAISLFSTDVNGTAYEARKVEDRRHAAHAVALLKGEGDSWMRHDLDLEEIGKHDVPVLMRVNEVQHSLINTWENYGRAHVSHYLKDRNGPDDGYVTARGRRLTRYKTRGRVLDRQVECETAIRMCFAPDRFCEILGMPRMHT